MLAYPAARIIEGYEWKDWQLKTCLAINIMLQIIASLSGNLFATWFGPVSIVGPVFFAAQLVANLIVFWIVLGLEAFSREMQIGTYIVVISVILLIVNGPGTQSYVNQTFEDFITRVYAFSWSILLLVGMMITGTYITFRDLHNQQRQYVRFAILLIARGTAFSLNLTTGKALVLSQSKSWLITNIVIKILSGAIYTKAIVVQSTAVSQKTFVPINAVFIILVNALTGIIVWEDWRVVSSWLGYTCVFLLMALGCSLLLGDLGLIQESAPETFRGARPTMIMKSERDKFLKNIKNIPKLTDSCAFDGVESNDRLSATYHGRGSTSMMIPSGLTESSTTTSKPNNTRRTTRASFHGLVSSSLTEMHNQRQQQQRPSLGRRSSSVSAMLSHLHRNPTTQAAWAAIYENGHATHQGSCSTDSSSVVVPPPQRTLHADIDDDDDDVEGNTSNNEVARQQRRRLSQPFRDGFAVCNWDSFRRRLIEEASGEISFDSALHQQNVATTDDNNSSNHHRTDEGGESISSSQGRLHDHDDHHPLNAGRGLEVLAEGIEDNSCSVLDDVLADTSSQDSTEDDKIEHA